jgi:hypothetical protein
MSHLVRLPDGMEICGRTPFSVEPNGLLGSYRLRDADGHVVAVGYDHSRSLQLCADANRTGSLDAQHRP